MNPDCGPECQETLRQIERFLDGELDPGIRAVIDKHLSSCSPCMERAEFRKHLKELIASKCGRDRMPADLLRRVEAMIDAQDAPAP
ncbi:MAG: mycothiol system anti-sigma-R factor [Actinobacteria bacterium]|nr:mycothiol system anti-sigma-R factor [Actinomycetota bacterium]